MIGLCTFVLCARHMSAVYGSVQNSPVCGLGNKTTSYKALRIGWFMGSTPVSAFS